MITDAMTNAEAAMLLAGDPDYRVLKRFGRRDVYAIEPWSLGDAPAVRLAALVDVETTGLDRENDEIIELGILPFTYDPTTGAIYNVRYDRAICSFCEPAGREISEEITELTGITPAMVKGHRLPGGEISALVEDCQLIIAHNAEYDRPILERRVDGFTRKHWACSQQEVPWRKFGVVGAKLKHVLGDACGEFYDGHRALDDCAVGIHVLAAATFSDRTAMSYLLESARQPTIRMWAIDSPFPKKETLKSHRPRYHWSDGKKGLRKGWYVDLKPEQLEAEKEWLLVQIYSGRVEERHAIALEKYGSRDRYSGRLHPQ